MALTEIEFVEKMKAGTATVEEAISFARSRPTTSPNAKKRIGTLTSGFKVMGLDITMPYKDLKDDKVLTLFTKENSPDKSNRAPNLQALENNIKDLFSKYAISGVMEKVPGSDIEVAMYPQLTGTGTVAGTQRTGMAGERPMRGLLPMEDFAKMYAEAVPLIQAEYGQATADLAKYHATTSHRPSQLQGLKKSDVTVSNNTITVAGKKVTKTDKKGRPPLTFDLDSPTGQLLKRNLDSTKSEFLFDTSTANFDDAFAKHITPRLEQYSELLPLAEIKVEGPDGIQLSEKPVTTPSAIRSIVPKIMLDQYNIPEALVQGVMGHVNDSILRKNYAGLAPSTDIPKLLENPSSFAVGDFGTTPKNINIDLLSDEDRAALIEDQKLTIIEEEKARRAAAGAAVAEAQAKEIKAKASVTPEEIARAAEVDIEKVKADELRRMREKEIRADVRASKLDQTGDTPEGNISDETIEKLKRLGLWDKLSSTLKSGSLASLAALKVVPGPVADLSAAVIEKTFVGDAEDPYDVAQRKGEEFVAEKLGQETTDFLPRMGGGAGVVVEMATGALSREKQDMKIPSMMQEAQDRQYDFGDEFGNIPDDEQGFVPKREKEADPRITI
jgi:hypothetical protein